MKKILLCLFALFLATNICFAAEKAATTDAPNVDNKKATVALLYINNAKTTYDNELNKKMMDNFDSVLKNYNVVPGARYIDLLGKAGITDITTAERSDIMEVFKGENVDYVVFVELEPFVRKEKFTVFTQGIDMTAIVPVKIIDLKNNKYLYNGKFTEFATDSTIIGFVGNKSVSLTVLDKVIEKMNDVIKLRLPIGAQG